MKKRLAIILCLAVAACAGPPPPPVAPPPFAGEGFAVTRDYLTSSEDLSSTVETDRPRAFVLLAPGKTSANRKLCKAYQTLPNADTTKDANPDAKIITTYWMLTAATVSTSDCKWLVANYDFDKASALRSAYQIPSSSGQFILAIDAENRPFYIDITRANGKQRKNAMLLWFAAARSLAPTAAGQVIKSQNMFDRFAEELCGGNVLSNVTLSNVGEAMATLSPVAIGRVAINAAGNFFCERRA